MLDRLMQHGIGVGGGSNIKSVQRGNFIWGADLKKTITISEIDINSSVIILNPYGLAYISSTDLANILTGLGKFMDNSTIEIERQTATNVSNLGMVWQVIEFSNVKQKQSGIIQRTSWAQTDPITISEVNLNKSVLFYHHRTYEATTFGDEANHIAGVFLDSPNSIKIHPNGGKYIHWQLIEFK